MKASTVAIANFKGGAGKTTLAHHLAAAAAEAGQRVLAVDTDPQGDLYRRLAGHLHRDVDRPPLTWATGCVVSRVFPRPDCHARPRRARSGFPQ